MSNQYPPVLSEILGSSCCSVSTEEGESHWTQLRRAPGGRYFVLDRVWTEWYDTGYRNAREIDIPAARLWLVEHDVPPPVHLVVELGLTDFGAATPPASAPNRREAIMPRTSSEIRDAVRAVIRVCPPSAQMLIHEYGPTELRKGSPGLARREPLTLQQLADMATEIRNYYLPKLEATATLEGAEGDSLASAVNLAQDSLDISWRIARILSQGNVPQRPTVVDVAGASDALTHLIEWANAAGVPAHDLSEREQAAAQPKDLVGAAPQPVPTILPFDDGAPPLTDAEELLIEAMEKLGQAADALAIANVCGDSEGNVRKKIQNIRQKRPEYVRHTRGKGYWLSSWGGIKPKIA
jgi:hypothetical protein